ncbi:hypothetical protein VNI00_017938 [Paramarasmius palmivorus]|uniref:Reverse transcriptase zinc-binding domain-containing protein n=1 Tax=Paramarasmius palmivorus TaxID=297713 RepID=A0AAW0B2B7_9AGAR
MSFHNAAIDRADKTEPLTIRTESKYAAQILDGKWQKLEDQGYIGVKNGEIIRTTVAKIRQRQAETYLLQVDNKTATENDRTAKKKANEALESGTVNEANTEIPAQYCISGVKLKTITQRTATKAIRIQKMRSVQRKNPEKLRRRKTKINSQLIRQAVATMNGKTPTDSQIWKSCKCPDIPMKIRQFMWKLIHDAQMVGDYWTGKSNVEDREMCKTCRVTETMEHILLKCKEPGQEEVWQLVGDLWNMKRAERWNGIDIGTILGSGLIRRRNHEGKSDEGLTRFWRILVTEAAYLVWKLRNERVIEHGNNKSHTMNEIHNRFIATLNTRLTFDRIQTRDKWDRKKISKGLVLATWRGARHDEKNLPGDWTRESGVLVGIRPV